MVGKPDSLGFTRKTATPQPSTKPGTLPDSPSKRSLPKVAWVAPVVAAVTLPRSGFAANVSGNNQTNHGKDEVNNGNNGNHYGQFKKP
jgi:hypothetical protein